MKEPSVLDYLKSRLNPWQSEKVELPEAGTPPGDPDAPKASLRSRMPTDISWRTLLALALALVGQFMLEPPNRIFPLALAFYTFAFALLIWAYFTHEFSLPSLPEDQPEIDPGTVRRGWLIAGIVLGVIAFLLSTDNLFTPLNVTLWLLSLAALLRSLWLHGTYQPVAAPEGEEIVPQPSQPFSLAVLISRWWDVALLLLFAFAAVQLFGANVYLFGLLPLLIALLIVWLRDPNAAATPAQRLKSLFARDPWQINLSRWAILILAVSAVIIFIRFYQLDSVPSEPFSDHAEKLLDVYDITQGQTHIFFERNTGREFIQFYWTALLAYLLNTGLTFLTLKIGTVLIGLLTLPYVYLLGKELGGKRVALFALILAGVAYWPNVISRIGLRFPLYPAFTAPVLFYLIRGLRTQKRNDFILSGLFLGLGLHGYTPFRFVPFVVLAAVGLYLLHKQSQDRRKQILMMLGIVVAVSLFVFLPLLRYGIDHPEMLSYRAMSRLTPPEGQLLPAPEWCPLQGNLGAGACTFVQNTFSAMLMFNWDNGEIWVHSVPHRPALDLAAAVLLAIGYLFILVRYLRERRWQDIFLLVSVPLLLMSSILSLAFPSENPSLNRTGGALVVVFVIAAIALDGLYTALQGMRPGDWRRGLAAGAVIVLLGMSTLQSSDLVFNQFASEYRIGTWNTSDMGKIIRAFMAEGNSPDNAWVVPFPYWVDTRLVGVQAGLPAKDFALSRDNLATTLDVKGNKMFIVKDEDKDTLTALRNLYPNGLLGMFDSPLGGKDFWIYTVPDSQTVAP